MVSEENESVLPVAVELALTNEQQAKGLMHREVLPPERGMLFIYENERELSFWMKDTLIPLDVLYFNAEGSFISSATMQPCTEDPCTSYPSESPAKYGLEVVAGFAEQIGITEEWNLAF